MDLVAGSIFAIPLGVAAHTKPPPLVIPTPLPASAIVLTSFVSGSIRETLPAW